MSMTEIVLSERENTRAASVVQQSQNEKRSRRVVDVESKPIAALVEKHADESVKSVSPGEKATPIYPETTAVDFLLTGALLHAELPELLDKRFSEAVTWPLSRIWNLGACLWTASAFVFCVSTGNQSKDN
jgi:hypothetical protein